MTDSRKEAEKLKIAGISEEAENLKMIGSRSKEKRTGITGGQPESNEKIQDARQNQKEEAEMAGSIKITKDISMTASNRKAEEADIAESIRKQLVEMADEKYRKFMSSLTPGKENILGVRIPLLRKLANKILKDDWKSFLINASDTYMEELILQGLVICGCSVSPKEKLDMVAAFVPKIDCWPVCDTFCSSLKLADRNADTYSFPNREMVWFFLQPYFKSEREYDVRFAVVMLLHYISPEYAPLVFDIIDNIKHDGYYARMAVAWVLSMYYVAYPKITIEYLKNNNLDDFTYNKTLQKIIESNRLDKANKDLIRSLKRK